MRYVLFSDEELLERFPDIAADNYVSEDDYDFGHTTHLLLLDGDEAVRYVASDGGEPEDNTFRRDWSWVLDELNSALGV